MRRRMRHRRALLPALAVTSLFLAAACSSPAPQAARLPAAGEGQRIGTTEPVAGNTGHSLTVAPAAAPTAAATATAAPHGSGPRAHRTTLTVSSYDGRTRRAVISGRPDGSAPHSPAPSATSSASAAPHRTAVGDVIASAPAPGAPRGLLAKVTKVIGETDGGTEVQTEPATLNALLGDATAKGDVPVDPASFTVDKLLPDVKVSWSKTGDAHAGPKGATVPLGSLRLDVGAEVPAAGDAAASATASVHGFVQVAPQVDFAYGGTRGDAPPGSAYLGVSGDWASGWSVKGRAAAGTGTPLRIPFAKLHADPVLQVGPVPVVVNLDLTCYLQISADGRATVDVEQSLKGDFKAGGTFGPARGWTPVSSSHMAGTPVHASVTTAGSVKTALGAEAAVGLYGTVGVTADLAPYLRGEAAGALTASSDGSTPEATGTWGVYGGVDLSGTLRIQLSVFGTPVVRRSVPLGALHHEWKLAGGSLSS
ncbi:hypothetical protein GCM10018980_43120 [Streptomyces capoamus]|uniref:Lipoprotein n=2 Tax=Streptomyces capoamus TaxID=68183 RepID=A0A919EXS7_9ACTN|nr:hypothetical protein GCM10010501_67120 [Streptomyces libani subsp. rufus]GHG56890.1 hypothetical protein GCM10018980_43120 [Streptomyces capoamus]